MTPKPTRLLAVLLLLATCAHAQAPIRIWGHGHRGQDYILTLLRAWQSAFTRTHPGIRFDNQLDGNASGLAGLYTNTADLAILDREASFIEVDAYQQGTGYDPFRIPVAMGSIATPHHAPALRLYVNRTNPLRGLTLTQVDDLFDADHRRGGAPILTWADLGQSSPRPIHFYALPIVSADMQFFERAAMKGSQKFASGLTLLPTPAAIIAATAKDRDGIAILSVPAPSLKPVPIDGLLPTRATLIDATYPLARTVYVYAHRKPGTALTPEIAAFLDFIVSPQGQAIAARTGGYLPLSPAAAAKAREALQ